MEILYRKLEPEITKNHYKNIAWFYDFWSRMTESKAAKCVIEFAHIKDNVTILEVACGTGVVFEQIVNGTPLKTELSCNLVCSSILFFN